MKMPVKAEMREEEKRRSRGAGGDYRKLYIPPFLLERT
jgi:hypothetical protein